MTDLPISRVRGSRVAVVGGSIAGCAAAIALTRAGCAVTVIERGHAELGDRGYGIAMRRSTWREFADAGYLDHRMPVLPCFERLWFVADPAAGGYGRLAWRQPQSLVYCNWGVVWRTLRARVADGVDWRAGAVTAARAVPGGVELTVSGRVARFDVVVGADGYRSAHRALTGAGRPRYAGYALWRGTFPVTRLGAVPADLHGAGVTVLFPGGHGGCYLIPGRPGSRALVNWGLYHPLDAHSGDSITSLPPGSVGDLMAEGLARFVTAVFPPVWADVVRRTRRSGLAVQPVYDLEVPSYTAGRVLLAGDAGAVVRPHAAVGVTKAIEDAMALERAFGEHVHWADVLAEYDRDRTARSTAAVALGRRLGEAQVGATPPWSAMTPADFRRWWASVAA